MYEFQGHYLCLSCYERAMGIIIHQKQEAERMINYLHDRIDETVGVRSNARIQMPQPIIHTGSHNTQNHIHVDRSVIGVINTGQIQSLNQKLDNISNNTDPELAAKLKSFTENMLVSKQVSEENKKTVFEGLSFLAEQLNTTQEKKPSIAKQIVSSIGSTIQTAGSLAVLWQTLGPLILRHLAN